MKWSRWNPFLPFGREKADVVRIQVYFRNSGGLATIVTPASLSLMIEDLRSDSTPGDVSSKG